MNQFFISYTHTEQPWAEWVAWQLENAGYPTILQAWDFRPGSNFVLEMQKALNSSSATIVILSEEYLTKAFPASEWSATFVQDPDGKSKRLIPVRVADVHPTGLLSPIVYIDLYNSDNEEHAVKSLLDGVDINRGKPAHPPAFPKYKKSSDKPIFPKNQNKLLPNNVEIEIRINQNFDSFSRQEQERIVRAIRELLSLDYDLKVSKIIRGSVILTLRLKTKDALKLFILNHVGKLGFLKVHEIKINTFPIETIDDALALHMKFEPTPPKPGTKETGKTIFLDEENKYGILERDAGGYLKFNIPKAQGFVQLGKKTSVIQKGSNISLPNDGLAKI